MYYPDCMVCGGGIQDEDHVIEFHSGSIDRSIKFFKRRSWVRRTNRPLYRFLVHRECLVSEIVENEQLNDGQKLKKLIERIADFDPSSNSTEEK